MASASSGEADWRSTPTTRHLSATPGAWDKVYEPAEDTFLLLDALTDDAAGIVGAARCGAQPPLCVEVGSGSGVAITFLGRLLAAHGVGGAELVATDVNLDAVAATQQTAEENGVEGLRAVRTDLVDAVAGEVRGRVHVLLFNPPYVVTPPDEVGTSDIAASWAGGADGREVTDRLLPLVPTLLKPRTGRFYLVAIEQNLKSGTPDDLQHAVAGCRCDVVASRKAGRESLSILRYTWADADAEGGAPS